MVRTFLTYNKPHQRPAYPRSVAVAILHSTNNPSRGEERSEVHIVCTRESSAIIGIIFIVVGDIGGASDVFFPAPPVIILRARFWLVESNSAARSIALSISLRARQRRTRIRHSGARSPPSGGGLPCLSRSLRSSAFFLAAHLVGKSPARTHGRLPALTPPPPPPPPPANSNVSWV